MTYAEKLKDPRWQRLRLEVYQRDGFACRYCQDTKTTLNVHHLEYSGNPWDAPIDKLITLCEHCHLAVETDDIHLKGKLVCIIKKVIENYAFLTMIIEINKCFMAAVYEIGPEGIQLTFSFDKRYLDKVYPFFENTRLIDP